MQLLLDLRSPSAPAEHAPTKNDSPESHSTHHVDLEKRRRQLAIELRMHLRTNVALVLHTNRQSMLNAERTRLGYLVRAHRIFAAAPPDVVVAIARLLDQNDRAAANMIDRYIDACSEQIAEHARPSNVNVGGQHYDLQRIFDDLNARYFSDAVRSRITWGRSGKAKRKHSIKLGSYHASERLIRIHPALDQARTLDGRRCVQHPEFRALEARFPQAAEALQWEHENLNRLLRFKG